MRVIPNPVFHLAGGVKILIADGDHCHITTLIGDVSATFANDAVPGNADAQG